MSIAMSLLSVDLDDDIKYVSDSSQEDDVDLLDYQDTLALEAAMLANEEILDEISQLMDQCEDIDTVSIEVLQEQVSPELYELLTTGDNSLTMEEAQVGGVSRFFNRLWNVYYTSIANQYDWITDLFKNNKKMIVKYKKRLQDAKDKFDDKKGDWTNGQHVGAYTELYNYYFNEKGWIKEPIKQLGIEKNASEYAMHKYPSEVEKLIKQFTSFAKRLDVSSPNFITDVKKEVGKLQHPAYIFDKNMLGGRPFMMNTGFHIIGKKPKKTDPLATLATSRRVSTTKILTQFTGTINTDLSKSVIPDVKMTTADLGKFIQGGFDLIAVVDKYYNSGKDPETLLREMKSTIERLQNTSKSSPKENQKVAKQLVRYSKNLMSCYYSPATKRAKQTLEVTKAVARLAGRIIAGAK